MSPSSDLHSLPGGEHNTLEPNTLVSDNKDLLTRLAAIQQQKWDLEEKVKTGRLCFKDNIAICECVIKRN